MCSIIVQCGRGFCCHTKKKCAVLIKKKKKIQTAINVKSVVLKKKGAIFIQREFLECENASANT